MSNELSVVLWKWKPKPADWVIEYTSENVNHLANQIRRFIGVSHQIYCITDDPEGLHPSIKIVPIEEMACPMPTFDQYSRRLHSCYRRMKLFDPDLERYFGKRMLQLDVDMVIVKDISNIASRSEPFVIWRSFSGGRHTYALNPSLILLDTGARADLWNAYCADADGLARAAFAEGWTGTEQAIIGYLMKNEMVPTFEKSDGIYAFRDDPMECRGDKLDPRVKMVSFHANYNPSNQYLRQHCQWLGRAWRESADHVPDLPVGPQIPGGTCQHPAPDGKPEPVTAA